MKEGCWILTAALLLAVVRVSAAENQSLEASDQSVNVSSIRGSADLFNRNSSIRNNHNNNQSLVGQNNPLTTRETEQQTVNAQSSGFGNTGGQAGGSGGARGAFDFKHLTFS